MSTVDFAEVSRTAHQLALDHGHSAHLYAANYPARPAPPVGKMSRVLEGRFSSIDPTVSRLTRTGTAFKSGRYLTPQSGRSSLAPTGSNPVRWARLRVKPRPTRANVYQRPAGCKLEIKLAVIRQR